MASVVLERPLGLWHFVAMKEGPDVFLFSFSSVFTKRIFVFLKNFI